MLAICDHREHAIASKVCDCDTCDVLAFRRSAPAATAFIKAVVVETFDQGGSFGKREKGEQRGRFFSIQMRFLVRWIDLRDSRHNMFICFLTLGSSASVQWQQSFHSTASLRLSSDLFLFIPMDRVALSYQALDFSLRVRAAVFFSVLMDALDFGAVDVTAGLVLVSDMTFNPLDRTKSIFAALTFSQ